MQLNEKSSHCIEKSLDSRKEDLYTLSQGAQSADERRDNIGPKRRSKCSPISAVEGGSYTLHKGGLNAVKRELIYPLLRSPNPQF